jgi:hypothetical protein
VIVLYNKGYYTTTTGIRILAQYHEGLYLAPLSPRPMAFLVLLISDYDKTVSVPR